MFCTLVYRVEGGGGCGKRVPMVLVTIGFTITVLLNFERITMVCYNLY